jgi:hypothetical protein
VVCLPGAIGIIMKDVKDLPKAAAVLLALTLSGFGARAQTSTPPKSAASAATAPAPAPTSSTMNFQIGADAFGISPTSSATPASDVIAQLNPGFAKLPGFSFVSDNLLAPGANLQFYGGGIRYDFGSVFPKTSALAPLSFYVRGTVGADRIVPATGPGQSHVAFLAGGGLSWAPTGALRLQLVEVDDGHFPGAPWGSNAPVVSGGLSIFFGKQ